MSKSMRWTEAMLKQHLGKQAKTMATGTGRATPESVTLKDRAPAAAGKRPRGRTALPASHEEGDIGSRAKPTRLNRVQEIRSSIEQARVEAVYEPGRHLEIRLHGAKILSANDLYALHHFERIAYRKTWHEAIYHAVLLATGGPRHLKAFTQFRLRAERVARRGLDLDALNGCFKYAIDGLRYAGVIVNDSPAHMLDMQATQRPGEPMIVLRVEAAQEDHQRSAANESAANATHHSDSGKVAQRVFSMGISRATAGPMEGHAGD